MATLRQWSLDGQKVGPLVGPWELFHRDARIVTLFGGVQSSVGANIIAAESLPLLAENLIGTLMLLAQDNSRPVKIILNTHGGDVVAGLNIIEAIEHLQAKGIEVWTVALGAALSMGSVILVAGTEGKRFALSRACVHFHSGKIHMGDMTPEVKAMLDVYLERIRIELNEVLVKRTKIPEYHIKTFEEANPKLLKDLAGRLKLVRQFMEREQFLTADEALKAGVIDHVLMPGDPILDEIYRRENNENGSEKGGKSP